MGQEDIPTDSRKNDAERTGDLPTKDSGIALTVGGSSDTSHAAGTHNDNDSTKASGSSDDSLDLFSHEPRINTIDKEDSSAESKIETVSFTTKATANENADSGSSSGKSSTLAIADWMSDNMLIVRYGLMASIGLLTAYGISQSPLMFRYRKISEIPASHFLERKTLHCRLLKVEEGSKRTTLYCQHLSIAERLLALFRVQWKSGAFAQIGTNDCLPIQLVGIEAPENESTQSPKEGPKDASLLQYMATDQLEPVEEQPLSFLHQLANERALVSCQLMARGVKESNCGNPKKRPIPGFNPVERNDEQLAFGIVRYRPKGPYEIFATDLGLELVERGEAIVATDLYGLHSGMKIVDADARNKLQKDAVYVSKTLADAERSACQKAHGIWKDELYRRQRQDFVDEVEFWERASWPRKLWRWLRGG